MEAASVVPLELSIRLLPDGFSFSIRQVEADVVESLFFSSFEEDLFQPFKQAVFENKLIDRCYDRVRLVVVDRDFAIIPAAMTQEADIPMLIPQQNLNKECHKQSLTIDLPDTMLSLAFSVDETIYLFLLRHFPEIEVSHRSALLLKEYLTLTAYLRISQSLFVQVDDGQIVVLSYSGGNALYAVPYDTPQPEDALYYILCIYQTLGLDQLSDPLFVHGERRFCEPLLEKLSLYVKEITYVEEEIASLAY